MDSWKYPTTNVLFFNQGIIVPNSWRRRLLLGVWMLFGQILTQGYCSNLISYMTKPGLQEAVDTVPKLARAIQRGNFACGTIRDAAEHTMLKVRAHWSLK